MSKKSRLKCVSKRKKKKKNQRGPMGWTIHYREIKPGEIVEFGKPIEGDDVQTFTMWT